MCENIRVHPPPPPPPPGYDLSGKNQPFFQFLRSNAVTSLACGYKLWWEQDNSPTEQFVETFLRQLVDRS